MVRRPLAWKRQTSRLSGIGPLAVRKPVRNSHQAALASNHELTKDTATVCITEKSSDAEPLSSLLHSAQW
jgi:hypothetical protein